jgi:hypothetical protein
MLHLDWAEPGDPPLRVFAKPGEHPRNAELRAPKPQGKPTKYRSLTAERERQLIRDYWEHGDLDALDWLVEAHRPMVVAMARLMWRGNGTSLKVLVEYGMLGLRFAAEPPRPSKRKKGKMVGFDLESGNRFSTYARDYARKQMQLALADDPYPERDPELEAKADLVAESWHTARSLSGMFGAPAAILDLVERRPGYSKPYRPWSLWHRPTWAKDQYERKVRPRILQHPRTRTELSNLKAYQERYSIILKSWEPIQEEIMEGWNEALESAAKDFLVASLCKTDSFHYGELTIRRKRKPSPFLCLRPLAGIYYMRGGDFL